MYKDVLYFGAADGHIYGLNPANGAPLSNLATPAIPKGRFSRDSRGGVEKEYVFGIEKKESQSRGVLLKFSDEFERVLWTQLAEREWSSEQPHVWKDWVIAGNCEGDVVAYGATDGKQAWSEHVKGCIRSFGHDESTLYIGVQEGTVYAYRPPRPQSFKEVHSMDDNKRRLIWHGMFLFLLGLLTGFAEQKFVNPRMGLAAHLEGVMNGTFLIALGAVWAEVKLSPGLKAATFWIALYGAYVNWLTTALAAVLGTAALSPITAAGHTGRAWQETLITVLFLSVGITTVLSAVLVLWGLRRRAA
jgi:hydroxylaminobenzene mutase